MHGLLQQIGLVMHSRLFSVCLILIGCIIGYPSHANISPKVIQSVTIENGGTNTVIYDINQDKFNRLWIASTEGLFIYNGKKATKIWPVTGSANTYSITNDNDNMYVGGIFGMVKFNARSLATEPVSTLAKYKVYDFAIANNEIIFNQFDNGLYTLNLANDEVREIAISDYVTSNDIKAIEIDKQGTVWVAVQANDSSKGLRTGGLLEIKNGKVVAIHLQQKDMIIANLTVFKDNFVVSTANNGILEFDPVTKTIVAQHYPSAPYPAINNLAIDNNGCFWLATMSQAQTICDEKISKISGNHLKNLPITDYQTVFFDPNNEIVWLGAINGGVRGIHSPKENPFSYSMTDKSANSLTG